MTRRASVDGRCRRPNFADGVDEHERSRAERNDLNAALRITCLVGTRPEAIKMAPVIRALQQREWAAVTVLVTSQHRDLIAPVLKFFEITPDTDLDVMTDRQSLPALTSVLLERVSASLANERPDLVVAQGDTTSVMATAMACFYAKVPFAHVEAGLRTGDLHQPFPEELNRIIASRIADLNFAPTSHARTNLLREGVDPSTIFITGNTVVDALLWAVKRRPSSGVSLRPGQRLVLVTLHRRESFGRPLAAALSAVRRLIDEYADLVALYPVHPNPDVAGMAHALLGRVDRLHLVPPLDYPQFVAAMQQADLIITDSGGIQEEAVTLNKRVLVARNRTERPEGVAAGLSYLVGTDPDQIFAAAKRALDDARVPDAAPDPSELYGDGHAGERIADIIEASFDRSRKRAALAGE